MEQAAGLSDDAVEEARAEQGSQVVGEAYPNRNAPVPIDLRDPGVDQGAQSDSPECSGASEDQSR